MEDILASIKRIIAEDSEAVGARPAKLRREAMSAVSSSPIVRPLRGHEPEPEEPEAVAEEPAAEADSFTAEPEAHAPEITPEPFVDSAFEPIAEQADAPDVLELTSPMPEAATAPSPIAEAPAATHPDGLVSTISAEASRSAFAALTQLQVRAEEGKSNTLEGLVSDLLKPMLKEWLDRELPGLVERLVSAEVSRLSRG